MNKIGVMEMNLKETRERLSERSFKQKEQGRMAEEIATKSMDILDTLTEDDVNSLKNRGLDISFMKSLDRNRLKTDTKYLMSFLKRINELKEAHIALCEELL